MDLQAQATENHQQYLEYFVPPPINELNRQYYLELKQANNPINHAAKFYMPYGQVFSLKGQSNYETKMLNQDLKSILKAFNKDIYMSMIKHIRVFQGQLPIKQLKNITEESIIKSIINFVQITSSIRRYQVKRGVCELMIKQTRKIQERTKQLRQILEEIKSDFLLGRLEDQKNQFTRD